MRFCLNGKVYNKKKKATWIFSGTSIMAPDKRDCWQKDARIRFMDARESPTDEQADVRVTTMGVKVYVLVPNFSCSFWCCVLSGLYQQ